MHRFSEAPITDLADRPAEPAEKPSSKRTPPADGGAVAEGGDGSKKDEGQRDSQAVDKARELLRNIGTEFSRLRKQNRSGAWADLEDRIAASGDTLVMSGMISSKDWVGMLIDIEQFRKSEGGTAESPGDALAKWLSEGTETKPKRKAKVQ
jgi:hypothetical protein